MTHWIFLLASLLTLSACKEKQEPEIVDLKREQVRIAEAIAKNSTAKLILFSIDPHDTRIFSGKLPENSDEVFHQYPILGSIEIVSNEEKKTSLRAFAKGIRESDGTTMRCFDPRHGLRIITESATNDFVICFECLSVKAYGFPPAQNFLTTHSPQEIFDNFLDKNQIKKAN